LKNLRWTVSKEVLCTIFSKGLLAH
jgi:hypothetical protein